MMKLRSATLVSKQTLTRISIVAATILLVTTVPLSLMPRAHADRFSDQINALQQQMRAYQAQADQLRRQADTLANKLAELNSQKAAVQSQIDLSQAQYDQLVDQITKTEQKIKDNQEALGTILADLYVDEAITPLEMLASSKNIGDYVDKQTLRGSMRDSLSKTIDEIKKLKVKLEADKVAVKEVLDKQTAQRNSLAILVNQQQQILDQTRGEEAAYQAQAASVKSQLESVAAQQRAYYQSLLASGGGSSGVVGSFQYANWSGNMACGAGGYPFCGGKDEYADPWGLYNQECVSYVAWALSARFGRYVGHFGGAGHAYQWPSTAPRNSDAVRVYDPQPGDAVILPATSDGFAPLGHAMIVESVGGEWIHVSQYNFYGTGEYSTMDIKNSGVVFLRFPDQ